LSIIDDFLSHYVWEIEFYKRLANAGAERCQKILDERNIQAIVTSRAKRPDRLREKLEKRDAKRSYSSLDDIYTDIPDLAGVRIAFYFPKERATVDRLLRDSFDVSQVKIFPEDSDNSSVSSSKTPDTIKSRFLGYAATHYRVVFRIEHLVHPLIIGIIFGSSMPADPLPAPPAVLVTQPTAAAQPIAPSAFRPTPIPPDATEEQLIGLWLHGKSANTIRAYRLDVATFRAFIGKPIRLAYFGDLQRYTDALTGSPASCARRPLVVKSLLSFAARMGFTPFNIGAAIRPPRPDDRLAERILDERQVFALLDAVEGHPRDHALIRLL
jgi:hypothetical protein